MGRKFHHKYYSCPEGENYCTKCDSYRPLDEFTNSKNGFNGKHNWCKKCNKEYNEKTKTQRALRMKRVNYGIAPDEYLRLWERQSGVCAICGEPETKVHKGTPILMAVDHNHQTGKVRGLLCSRCNTGLGVFQDDRDLLQRAVGYLLEADEERTQNPRHEKDARHVPEIKRHVELMTREAKGLPKQLRDDATHTDLPLFMGASQ